MWFEEILQKGKGNTNTEPTGNSSVMPFSLWANASTLLGMY